VVEEDKAVDEAGGGSRRDGSHRDAADEAEGSNAVDDVRHCSLGCRAA